MGTSSPPAASYGAEFFQSLRDGSRRSAEIVIPELIALFQPTSVVDIGCGTGSWLSVFIERGVADVLGVDGSWTAGTQREISDVLFLEHDLRQPLELNRSFDLAVCLEVAEHLPPEAARPLVESLTRLAPIVLFSAAIPFQGGDGHVNERWPSFWSDLFASHGFRRPIDLRCRFWTNDAVEFWYRQNMACYIANDRLDILRRASSAPGTAPSAPMDVVHPHLYQRLVRESDWRKRHADELEQRNHKLEQRIQRLRAELTDARSELARIKNSRAWRYSERLRRVLRAGKRLGAALRMR